MELFGWFRRSVRPADNPQDRPSLEELRRVALLHDESDRLAERCPRLPLRCPCCECRTLNERGSYEICPVCLWEDDSQDEDNADEVSGVNGSLSLSRARANYRLYGASSERRRKSARPPRGDELPEPRHAEPGAAADGGA